MPEISGNGSTSHIPAPSRRNVLTAFAAAGAAAPLLAACSSPSSPGAGTTAKAPASLGGTPSAPVTLNILDVAGNLALTKPMIEAFKTAHPEVVSHLTYSTGTAPQLASKVQAQQQAGNVQIHLVLTGTDGLAAGIQNGLWTGLKPYYDTFFPGLMTDYQPAAAAMTSLAQDQGIELTWYPSGPLLEYDPAKVASPPATTDALLDWAKANSGKFQYARPANSGPGRTFLMGLPYLLGDSDPTDPVNGWSRTWAYLTELGKHVDSYPSGTTAVMKNLAAGSVHLVATTTGWYINPRALGTVPPSMKVAKFTSFTWVSDAHYGVVPKGVSADVLTAVLRLLAWMLTPEQQAFAYDAGYFYPGPAVKNVPLSKAPADSQKVIAQFGEPQFDAWMDQFPIKNSLPAATQVTAFDLWDRKIGSTK
ncbi:extracellular solute-binding protein family 1 [Catenulispora acidiphila DSM 44928]|uniref:Extracellular solute-binding protein family 1 n=1 Tax=Catenulispora acidiphila (strain DSM 44928 / JCM 14897 / NBRC 102108 / NRRL B-24433 / ID139908) TaxID=479433 RepID=C7Q3E3_CATAD|nr:extracellular solute-binding protein [Catenulispora acidiphila]ACU75708.1 extracellular solute-binding protein family 1 [Catenulispora acidiphila DSM 44928]